MRQVQVHLTGAAFSAMQQLMLTCWRKLAINDVVAGCYNPRLKIEC